MAYKCLSCGHIFEEGEQARWSEDRGEFWGVPCAESLRGCPMCHGDYAETKPCELCDVEHFADDLFGGVCMECLRNELTKEVGIRYILTVPEWIEIFGCNLLNCSVPEYKSREFRDLMHRYVFHHATREQVQDFILDEDDACTEDFAKWLKSDIEKREVTK